MVLEVILLLFNILSQKLHSTKITKITSQVLTSPIIYVNLTFNSANYWRDPANRRKFFENFARKKGFSPLVIENWYSVTKEAIFAEKVNISCMF